MQKVELFLERFVIKDDDTVTDNSKLIDNYSHGDHHITFLQYPAAIIRVVTCVDRAGLWGFVIKSQWVIKERR